MVLRGGQTPLLQPPPLRGSDQGDDHHTQQARTVEAVLGSRDGSCV